MPPSRRRRRCRIEIHPQPLRLLPAGLSFVTFTSALRRGGDDMERHTERGRAPPWPVLATVAGCSRPDSPSEAVARANDASTAEPVRRARPAPHRPGGPRRSGQREPGRASGEDARRLRAPAPDYLSTFALDVDTASYGYARRTLGDGRLPDPATVRPEEFVNSFRQDYQRPTDNGFSVTVDGARTGGDGLVAWSGSVWPPAPRTGQRRTPARRPHLRRRRLRLDGRARPARPRQGVPRRAHRRAARRRLRRPRHLQRRGRDRAADDPRSASNRGRIRDAVDELEPTDSTNVERGRRAPATTTPSRAAARAPPTGSSCSPTPSPTPATPTPTRSSNASTTHAREHGITLFGVGVGSDYGDALMERLADKGDGHTTYVSDRRRRPAKVFVDQLPAHVELRARDAKAQVAFDRRTVEQFRLIGYENRRGRRRGLPRRPRRRRRGRPRPHRHRPLRRAHPAGRDRPPRHRHRPLARPGDPRAARAVRHGRDARRSTARALGRRPRQAAADGDRRLLRGHAARRRPAGHPRAPGARGAGGGDRGTVGFGGGPGAGRGGAAGRAAARAVRGAGAAPGGEPTREGELKSGDPYS